MESDSAIKFGFAFSLAVLFHLFLLALVLVGFNIEPTMPVVKKPIAAMQATLLEAAQLPNQADNDNFQAVKVFSPLEEKRLAAVKQRLEQIEKEKLLAAAAQKMLLEAMREKQEAIFQKTKPKRDIHLHKTPD